MDALFYHPAECNKEVQWLSLNSNPNSTVLPFSVFEIEISTMRFIQLVAIASTCFTIRMP